MTLAIFGRLNSLNKISILGGVHYKIFHLVIFFFFLQDEIFITVGPWLMKLYTTPHSILTLVTWVPQSRLAFGQTESYSVQPRLPLAATIGPAGRSRVFFYWVRPASLMVGPNYKARSTLSYSYYIGPPSPPPPPKEAKLHPNVIENLSGLNQIWPQILTQVQQLIFVKNHLLS